MRRKRAVLGVIVLAAFAAVALAIYISIWRRPVAVDGGAAVHHLTFKGHRERVWAVELAPGGLAASAGVDPFVPIFRLEDGVVTRSLPHPAGVTNLAFSADGRRLATVSYDGRVRLFEVGDGRLLHELAGHQGTAWAVALSPDGSRLASGGEDKLVRIWDATSGALLQSLDGHALNVWSVAFSPDGRLLASGSFDKNIKMWRVADGALLRTLAGHEEAVLSVDFSPDGRALVSGADDSTVRVWSTDDGSLIRTLRDAAEHVYHVAWSPDGAWILSGHRDQNALGELFQNFGGERAARRSVTARLWRAVDGRMVQSFAHHDNDVHGVAFAPDGRFFALASEDGTVSLWKLTREGR